VKRERERERPSMGDKYLILRWENKGTFIKNMKLNKKNILNILKFSNELKKSKLRC